MSNTASQKPHTDEIAVGDFIDGQLGMLQRRVSPEQRAEIIWWRERVAVLAKQKPTNAPLKTEVAA